MFREIRRSEKITDKFVEKEEDKAYQQIKPETEATYDDAKKFVEDLFSGLF